MNMNPGTARPSIDLLQRIQCEFLEMPGLRLTQRQAQRLWALDANACSAILETLVDGGFLSRTRDGSFSHVDQARPVILDAAASPLGSKISVA
jgi:hypothetical protein